MGEHRDATYSNLHKAKFDSGVFSSLPANPDGVGDIYWASDTEELYIADAAGTAWVLFSPSGGSIDASAVTYTPLTLTDWDSSADPGDANDAFDQLAERLKIVETTPIPADAADITYTPLTLTDWSGSADPGNTDDALDQLADRVNTIETSGAPVDASVVTYTPLTLADWDSSADPGNGDDAFDQLASRVKTLEGAGGGSADSALELAWAGW